MKFCIKVNIKFTITKTQNVSEMKTKPYTYDHTGTS